MTMSSIKHRVLPTASAERKSSAEENARTAKPNSRNKSGKDSRTDSSSSITDTSERSVAPIAFDKSIAQQCSAIEESSIVLWYWFTSDVDETSFHAASTARVVCPIGVSAPAKAAGLHGMENPNVAPGPSFGAAHRLPS